MAPELNFITSNEDKLAEVAAILGDTVQLRNQSLDLIEIQGTIDEISVDKCQRAAEMASQWRCKYENQDWDGDRLAGQC